MARLSGECGGGQWNRLLSRTNDSHLGVDSPEQVAVTFLVKDPSPHVERFRCLAEHGRSGAVSPQTDAQGPAR